MRLPGLEFPPRSVESGYHSRADMGARDQDVKELLREGKNREAAELLIAQGELSRAMEAYAAVWDYAQAAEVALAASDYPAALDYLLRDGNRAGSAKVLGKLAQAPADEAERAVETLLKRGEKDHAARLLESRGDLQRAAEFVKELGEARGAASLMERAGQLREAGRLYERLVSEDPNDTASALSLGTILRRFGKNELAARMLQVDPKTVVGQSVRALFVPLSVRGRLTIIDAMDRLCTDPHSYGQSGEIADTII